MSGFEPETPEQTGALFDDPARIKSRKTWSTRPESTKEPWDAAVVEGTGPLDDALAVRCPKCRETAIVERDAWLRDILTTRPCTYCWKPSPLPRKEPK